MSNSNLLSCKVVFGKYLRKFLCYPRCHLPCWGQEFNGKKSEIKMRWFIVLRFASESDLEAERKMLIYLPNISESTVTKSQSSRNTV